MPKISYANLIWVFLFCYFSDYKAFDITFAAGLLIACWNVIADRKSLFGFVSLRKYQTLERKLEEHKTEQRTIGQDAVFNAYLFNKILFQKHVNIYMEKKGLEFNSKNKPKEKDTVLKWRKTLEVDEHADEEAVNLAYKELVKKYHPDRNHNPEAKDKLVQLNLAKEEADKFFGAE